MKYKVMRNFFATAILAALSLAVGAAPDVPDAAADGNMYLSVSAGASMVNGKPALKFSIKNISGQELHLNGGLIPWGWPTGYLVLTAVWRWGDSLEHAPPPPPAHMRGYPQPIDLKPGQSVEGTALIDNYIVGLDQAQKKGEVIVFWWTDIWDDKKRLGKFGGWVDFQKTTPGDVQ